MYERFTDRARKVMQLANQEAQRADHEYIGTEHILLGLAKQGKGVAAVVLKNFGIDLPKIRLEVAKIVPPGPDTIKIRKLAQTPRAKKAIEYAIEEARNLNHDYVGSEHVLLGLMREDEGLAAQILKNLGLSLKVARQAVLDVLAESQDPENAAAAADPVAKIEDLPEHAQPIVLEFDRQIAQLEQEKEHAILAEAWSKAASLRDLRDQLKTLRTYLIHRWPQNY